MVMVNFTFLLRVSESTQQISSLFIHMEHLFLSSINSHGAFIYLYGALIHSYSAFILSHSLIHIYSLSPSIIQIIGVILWSFKIW